MQLCQHCGANLSSDEPLRAGDFLLDPRGPIAYYKGREIKGLRKTQVLLLHGIAKALPGYLSTDAMLNRVSDSDSHNVIYVQLCELKKRLSAQGVPYPLKNVRGYGQRWDPDFL